MSRLSLSISPYSVVVDAGDLILFSRQCTTMDMISCMICLAAKIGTGKLNGYDHIGIVVRNMDTNELEILEANVSGVTLRNLKDRLDRTRSNIIGIRKIIGQKTC